MAVYLELTTDLFSSVFQQTAGNQATSRRAGTSSARRPLRGLEVKDDTYAQLRVVDVAGNPIPVFDSSASGGMNTDGSFQGFILQSVMEARMEKHQIVETFGDSYVFFFGESPRFLEVQAIVLNSNDFNWEAEFWSNYDTYWRGTKLTELGARLYMFYDDNVVEGYMLQAQAVKTADIPLSVTVTFKLFLTNYQNVSFITDDFPVRASASLPPGTSLQDGTAYSTLLDASDQASQLRGANEEAAQLAIQQQALAQFGGGLLLARALAGGYSSAMGPMMTGAGLGVGGGVSAGVSAGISAGAAASIGGNVVGGGVPVYGTADYLGGNPYAGVLPVNSGFPSGLPYPSDSIFGPGYAGIYSAAANPYPPSTYPQSLQRTTPLRGKITDDIDEWTGSPTLDDNANFQEPDNITDVDDLPYASILMLGAYGVQADGYASLGVLGLSPRFTPAGVGIGAGTGFSAGASFGFSATVGVGANAGIVAGVPGAIGYGASVGVGTTIAATGPYASSYLTNANGFTQPPPVYGTPYSNYPGYGSGYGSAAPGINGGYAPGPSLGIGASASISAGSSYGGGIGVGAVSQVGGAPTCFALESYPGSIYATGNAYEALDGTITIGAYAAPVAGVPLSSQ